MRKSSSTKRKEEDKFNSKQDIRYLNYESKLLRTHAKSLKNYIHVEKNKISCS